METYYIKIDENTGLQAISLVENPAVEKDFYCFSKEKPYQINNEVEHKISGVVCLADTPIYRNQNGKEFYLVFSKEAIKQMIDQYSKRNLINSVTLEHNEYTDGIYLVESYLKNADKGINPKGFEDVPDGSWFVTFKVENQALWDEIVSTNKYNGFSLEGFFNFSSYLFKQDETYDSWIESFLQN